MERLHLRQEVRQDRVPRLVVGGDHAILLFEDPAAARAPPADFVARLFQVSLGDLVAPVESGDQRRFVDDRRDLRPGEARGSPGESVEIDRRLQAHLFGVHFEDLLSSRLVGEVDGDLAVETTRTQERRIEDVRSVGGGEDDHAAIGREAVHFDEDRVEGLLPLLAPPRRAGGAAATDRIDLIEEDDAGRVLAGTLEEIADPGGADPDVHLDEVAAGDAEVGNPRLPRDRAGEKGLPGSRRSDEEHPAGDASAESGEAAGIAEELDDLLDLRPRLLDPRDVVEGDLGKLGGEERGFRATYAAAPGGGTATGPPPDEKSAEDQPGDQLDEGDRVGVRAALHLDLHGEAGVALVPRLRLFDQLGEDVLGRDVGGELRAARRLRHAAELPLDPELTGEDLEASDVPRPNLGADDGEVIFESRGTRGDPDDQRDHDGPEDQDREGPRSGCRRRSFRRVGAIHAQPP